MEKYKYPVYNPESMTGLEYRETSFSNDTVLKIEKFIRSLSNEKTEITQAQVRDNFTISWGIIEEIDDKKYLTHQIVLKKVN